MTEIHDPIRLLAVVEQTPELALAAARRKPTIFEYVEHAWVRYACVHPESRRVWVYDAGSMHPLRGTAGAAAAVRKLARGGAADA